jgi:hypothetical protein
MAFQSTRKKHRKNIVIGSLLALAGDDSTENKVDHMISIDNLCGDPGLPPGIPVMHTIHDPRKTVMNSHNRAGITEYIIHYITSRIVLHGHLAEFKCHAGQVY